MILFGLPMFSMGLLGATIIGTIAMQGSNSVNWPQVEGRIVASSIDERQRVRQGRTLRRYKPIVAYEYEVNGQYHKSNRIAHGVTKRSESRQEVETLLADYPMGAEVPIYYSPSNPRSSVLKPGLPNSNGYWVASAITGVMSLLGAWMLVRAFLGRRVKPKKPAGKLAQGSFKSFGNPASAS